LTSTKIPLPVFDENLDTNPKFQLKQLYEFTEMKGILWTKYLQ
jgi:hypothetical protein